MSDETQPQRVLVIDDDQAMCELVAAGLEPRGYEVVWKTDALEATRVALGDNIDAVITDLNLGESSGLELCEKVATNRPDVPVIVITAFGSMESAVAAIRVGAYDFINKPLQLQQLALTLERALRHRDLGEEVRRLRQRVAELPQRRMIGESSRIRQVRELVARVAETDTSVLITGESGTGKELVARAIHDASGRADGPFVAVNCAAMPANLLESELFGHVKGAFTDARSAREGLFRRASGGTLFLDEVGEMALEMQPKLLRVLQESRLRPVGGDTEIAFDARIITATNRDLDEQVEAGAFREDLFYRINVVRIAVPPLRARGNDVLLLAQHFLQQIAEDVGKRVRGIAAATAERLTAYDWPGNVRELENSMQRAVALTRYQEVAVEDLPEKIRTYKSRDIVISGSDPDDFPTLEELERRYILRVLDAVGGNKSQAAQILGLDRRTLYRKLERYDE
jgi:DNA-binding NtrC family response regulator